MTRVTRENITSIINFYMANNFELVWENGSSIRLDRKSSKKHEIVYIPKTMLNYKRYITSQVIYR